MRAANLDGRLVLIDGATALDVHRASGGTFACDPAAAYARWTELVDWSRTVEIPSHLDAVAVDESRLGPPSPRPRQIFAIGLNYSDHASETGMTPPADPMVFTKFPTAVTGPFAEVALPGAAVDWEAELVVVIGAGGRAIAREDARSRIAGFTVGQDLSERSIQMQSTPPQFSLGKSFAGFAPIGPAVVTLDEFADPDALSLRTVRVSPDGASSLLQDGTTANLIFSVDDLVSRLSHVVELLPGDLIFTGTPAGVGMGMTPPQYVAAGDTLHTDIEGIGRITQTFVEAR